MKWIYFPMFDHHITVSEHTAQELSQASRGHKVRRGIWVAPMGVDSDRFTPYRKSPQIRRRLLHTTHAAEGTTILFYAGRLAPEKNLSLLVETAARLDPSAFRLAVAGGGILLDSLKEECETRGLRHIVFLGHVHDRELLADYFANADIFVHPNPREPFGITPLEAMAAGLPLVVPDRGGVTSYANRENAWLAEPHPAAFASVVKTVKSDPEARERKALAARKTAEDHCWANVTARYLKLYRELHSVTQGQQVNEAPYVEVCV
jgi:alpha-1,6-mannosyltransferase